jgi:hypothetical protein
MLKCLEQFPPLFFPSSSFFGKNESMDNRIRASDEERTQLKTQHKKERDGRIGDRIKAVLLCDKGWSIPQIAEALLLSDDAIREHIFEYRESKKLKPESGGSFEKLSVEHLP